MNLNLAYLSCGVARVPESISKVLSWAGGGVNYFDGQAWVPLGFGGFTGPVGLRNLLPHHNVEPGTGLVAEHKASIIVISLCVYEESSTEVHGVELVVTCWRKGAGENIFMKLWIKRDKCNYWKTFSNSIFGQKKA